MKKVLSIILTVVMLLSTLSIFSVLSVSAANIGDGGGAAADKPAGSGTQNDPYLIASLANLKWIRDEIINIEGSQYQYWKQNANFPTGSNGTFAGVYFEQTADINLGGSDFTAIGGYMHDSYLDGQTTVTVDGYDDPQIDKHADYNYFAAFSGIYNGNGYKIHNGTISGYTGDGAHTNHKWATGLFGAIYGATLKNIVLENITVDSYNMETGALVGIARSPLNPEDPNAGKADFNLIENCVVRNCTVTAAMTSNANSDWDYTGSGRIGGMVGTATGTTFRGCKNENTMVLSEVGTVNTGGIVGAGGNGLLMENCVNTGTIRYIQPDGSSRTASEISFGGIVGTVMGKGTQSEGFGAPTKLTQAAGSVVLRDCYNSGAFENNVSVNTDDTKYAGYTSGYVYWAGIAGSAIDLPYVATADWYLMENCHNAFAAVASSALNLHSSIRIAGILSGGWCKSGADWSGMTVRDCYSVDVTESSYTGTNEVRWHGSNKSSSGTGTKNYATVEGANANGTATKSATEMATVTGAIDTTIAKMHARGTDKVTAIGYQEALDGSSYRVVLGINSLRWYSIGAEITLTVNGQAADTPADKSDDVVYNAVQGMEGGQLKTYTASDCYVGYLTTLDISEVAATGTSVYTIKTYTQDQGAGHAKSYGDVIVVTFTDGAFTSAVLNPTQS